MLLAALCLSFVAQAASASPQGSVTRRPPAPPAPVIVPGGPLDIAGRVAGIERADGFGLGAPPVFEGSRSDSVPLPNAPRFVLEQGREVLAAEATGDPHFLGFCAGRHYPPADERIDPELLRSLRGSYDDGRPAQETYGFVMFDKRITEQRLAQLRRIRARPLQFHPHYSMKVALPQSAIESVAALEFVRWIGVARPWQKVHPELARQIASSPGDERIAVYVNLFDSDLCAESEQIVCALPFVSRADGGADVQPDGLAATRWMSNGWQQRALSALGVDVHEYIDSVRAFRARMAPASLEQVVALDFVQFVEADTPPVLAGLAHDESTPLIMSDLTRATYTGGSSFSVTAGIVDSGLRGNHVDLSPARRVGWDWSAENNPFLDGCGHGTHVAGTVLGRGVANAGLRGNAPGLGWGDMGRAYVLKIAGPSCTIENVSLATIFGVLHTNYFDGTWTTTAPHVNNHSYGSLPTAGGYFGTEAVPRQIDDEVNLYARAQVFSAGNAGPGASTISAEGSAKNAITVGAVADRFNQFTTSPPWPGGLASFSSRGPCGDGRWKPNLTAPGDVIRSASNTSANGYANKVGTSMAAPHVTGLAAQLMDHATWMQLWPEPLAAVLMASATTSWNVLISGPLDTHLNEYGAGRVQAYRAHYGSSQLAWYAWYYALGNNSTYADFVVNPGATRLVVCLFYTEPSASAGASIALVNDFDLYIDQPPVDTANNNTGDWVFQQSNRDNTEIRSLDNPATGTWRWKVWPRSVTGSTYQGVAVQVIYGDTTPDITLSVTADDAYVQPNENASLRATVTNPGFVASAVWVRGPATLGDTLQSATTTLYDGAATTLNARDVTLGDIPENGERQARWTTRWATEGLRNWSVTARSDNAPEKQASVDVYVDGTPPDAVTGFASTTHTPSVWSNNMNASFVWSAAPDNLSGIDGYGFSVTGAPSLPPAVKSFEQITDCGVQLLDGSWYFNLRAVDNCGNWSNTFASAGPYAIDMVAPSGPSNLTSTSHTAGVQSCDATVDLAWSVGSDLQSGLAGYVGIWDTSQFTQPTGATNHGPASTGTTSPLGSSGQARYFHLRAKDVAGNYGTTQHYGPVYVDAQSVASYCTGKTNSLGCVPTVGTNGAQPSKSAGSFTVQCSQVISQKIGHVFWGYGQSSIPFQGGFKCVAAPTHRTANQSSGGSASGNDCTGAFSFAFSTAYMNANAIQVGDTLFCQWWMRDPGVPSSTGLSNALRFTVCQ